MIQIVHGRLWTTGRMRMGDTHDTQVHWKHIIRKAGEPEPMRGERRHHDLVDQYLVPLFLASQEKDCLPRICVEDMAQDAVDDGLLEPNNRQGRTPTTRSAQ